MTRLVIVLAIVLAIGAFWSWWHYVRSNPKRVFEAAVSNNLKVRGVTDHLLQSNGNQKLDQTVQLMTGPENTAHASTVLSQEGSGGGSVQTETIGTPFADYVRYTSIMTSQKNAEGKPLDFSKILGVWGTTGSTDSKGDTNGDLYNQIILGIVPFANLPAAERTALLKQIKDQKVYDVDYSHVEHKIVNGRPVYIYKVTVKPEAFVGLLKTLGSYLGLTQLETVDPSSYKQSPPLKVELGVDVWTRQLNSATYVNNDRTERLSAYGVQRPVELPKNAVSTDELQTRVQSIQ